MPIPATRSDLADLARRLATEPIARGAAISLALRLAALAAAFAQAALTARILGPVGYGATAVALSSAVICGTLAVLGMGGLSVREVARLAPPARWGFVRSAGVAVFAASMATGAALSAFALWRGGPFEATLALAGPLVPLFTLLFFARGVSQGMGRVAASQGPGEVLRPVLTAGALALIWAFGHGLEPPGFMALTLGATAIAVGFGLRGALRGLAVKEIEPPRPSALAKAAGPFWGAALLTVLLAEATTLLTGALAGAEAAGLFQPVARIAPIVMLIPTAVVMRFAPEVAERWSRGERGELVRRARLVSRWTAAGAAATAAAILILGPWILGLFGPSFGAAMPALWWVAGGHVINAVAGPVGLLLNMTGAAGKTLIAQALGVAMTLAVGLAAIPAMGAEGAGLAMAAGVVAANLGMWVFAYRRLGFDASALGLFGPRSQRSSGDV